MILYGYRKYHQQTYQDISMRKSNVSLAIFPHGVSRRKAFMEEVASSV